MNKPKHKKEETDALLKDADAHIARIVEQLNKRRDEITEEIAQLNAELKSIEDRLVVLDEDFRVSTRTATNRERLLRITLDSNADGITSEEWQEILAKNGYRSTINTAVGTLTKWCKEGWLVRVAHNDKIVYRFKVQA